MKNMKQKICIAIIVLLSISSGSLQAQQLFGAKGQKVLIASGNLYSEKDELINANINQKLDLFTYGLNLNYGKFYKKNVLSTANVGFARIMIERESLGVIIKEPRTFLNAGISQTYYTNLGKKFYFGIGGTLSGFYGKQEYSDGGTLRGINKYYVGNFSIIPSLSYQLNKRFVSNLSTGNNFIGLNYVNSKTTETSNMVDAKRSNTNFELTAGFTKSFLGNLNIGFSYLLK